MEYALQLLSDPSCPQRPSKKLCNRESSWTPLWKKTKVRITS